MKLAIWIAAQEKDGATFELVDVDDNCRVIATRKHYAVAMALIDLQKAAGKLNTEIQGILCTDRKTIRYVNSFPSFMTLYELVFTTVVMNRKKDQGDLKCNH